MNTKDLKDILLITTSYLFIGIGTSVCSFIIYKDYIIEKYKNTKTITTVSISTLADKNNNPLNVKASNNNWKGQIGIDKFDHAKFSIPEYGIRAGAYTLMTYYHDHKISTLHDIVHRFCTGNRKEYIKFLSKRLNIKPKEKFNVLNRLPELLQAMTRFESGKEWNIKYFIPYSLVTTAYNKGKTNVF